MVLRRRHLVPLVEKHKPVSSLKLEDKHYVYEVVRREEDYPIPDIKCLLTEHVDG